MLPKVTRSLLDYGLLRGDPCIQVSEGCMEALTALKEKRQPVLRVVERSGLSYSLRLKALLPVDTQQIIF